MKKEFLKLNSNIVPQYLMNKKVVGWAVEEDQEIVIEIEGE